MALLAVLLLVTASIRVVAASRAWLTEIAPIPLSDNLAHPSIVASLEQILTERDSDELRFITAVAHHLAGDTRRAAELYRSIQSDDAKENLRDIDSAPDHMPTAEMFVAAFHRTCPYQVWHTLGAAWQPRPPTENIFAFAAYEASQAFYLSLLLAATLLLLVAGSGWAPRAFPAMSIALFVVGIGFIGVALSAQHAASVKAQATVSGKYSYWLEPTTNAYPYPPDPTAEQAALHAMANSEAMRLFWISVAIAALVATVSGASVARERFRGRQIPDTLLDQPLEMEA
jgi:hypothetical protein